MFRKIVSFMMFFLIISVSFASASPSGTVWSTGLNATGQLGLGDNGATDRISFTQTNLADVVAIVAGGAHSVALKSDGTVWTTGQNCYGQLGLQDWAQRIYFTQTDLTNVISIAAGAWHTLALKSDGTVWITGANDYGGLGLGDNGEITDRNSFTQVPGLTGVAAIAGGFYHSLVLKSDGTVWATGYNIGGQLGLGDTTDRTVFTQVPGLTGVVAIAGGDVHSLALKSNGTVWTTGHNIYGQLGLGDNTARNAFTQVPGLTGVVAISAGWTHSLALKNDGTLWTAGGNGVGQLGLGDNTDRNSFTQVPGLTNVHSISGGGFHSLVIKNNGTAWTTGSNSTQQIGMGNGKLGLGDTTDRNSFTQVPGLTGIFAIAGGGYHSLTIPGPASPATPVGYTPAWLIITLVSLTIAGAFILRKRMVRR